MTENLGDNIALTFNQVGVSSLYPPRPLLNSISGYVVKGGITASKCSEVLTGFLYTLFVVE